MLFTLHHNPVPLTNLVGWLVMGSILGWLASRIILKGRPPSVTLNVVAGVAGAVLGGWLVPPLVGVAPVDPIAHYVGSLVAALQGAVFLLAVVALVRWRGRAR